MRSWPVPTVPDVPGHGPRPLVHDTATGAPLDPTHGEDLATMYVCGITPYDATHLGHAGTYLAFDTLGRVWRDAGLEVRYAQNTTDVDDPLLERAAATGVDWRELAASQIDLFRRDMEALRVIPPDDYVAVTDEVGLIAEAVGALVDSGHGYAVPTEGAMGDDIYFDVRATTHAWQLGDESRLDVPTMLALSAERGGDPDRRGKRDPLDPLLWRAARPGEPSWDTVVGSGRPGWHIECSVIANDRLGGTTISVQGGGSDLVFPHHEMSAGHTAALTGEALANAYVHAGMIAYQGTKISKSLGNLVTVRGLIDDGMDPRAVRLALLGHRYSDDWEWFDAERANAETRLAAWDAWAATADAPIDDAHHGAVGDTVALLRERLADDLDTPGAVAAVDSAIVAGDACTPAIVDAIDALLGIRIG